MFYEMKKIISKKGLILWGIFLLSSSLIVPLYNTYNYRKVNSLYYENMQTLYQEIWQDYKGKGSVARISQILETQRVIGKKNPLDDYMYYLCKKSARQTGKSIRYYFDFFMEKHSIQGLEKALSEIENTQSYSYQDLSREKEMMESCKLQYINTDFWDKYDVYETMIVLIIYLFIVFILAGTYTKERLNNMNFILCSAKIGKFRIITDKWLAGCLLGIGSILIVNLNLVIAFIIYGSSWGYNADIVNLGNGLVYSPYDIAIWQYMLLKVLFQSIGVVFLVVFVEYMSLLSEYRYPVVLYGSLLFLPQMVFYIVLNRDYYKILDILYDWSLLAAVNPEHAFYKYHTFNFFGMPVDYNMLYVFIMISFIFLMGIFTVRKYHQRIYLLSKSNRVAQ